MIIIANNLFPPLARGGAEIVADNLVRGCQSLGHPVAVISTRPYFSAPIENISASVYRLPSLYANLAQLPKPLRLLWHWYQLNQTRQTKTLLNYLSQNNCQYLITNNLLGLSWSLGTEAQQRGIKWIHILHDIQLLHPSGLLDYGHEAKLHSPIAQQYQRLINHKFGQPDLVVSPSKWLLDLHQSAGLITKGKTIISLNPESSTTRTIGERARTAANFGYLGQLEEHKGVLLLIEAFLKYLSQYPQSGATLNLVGDGQALKKAVTLSQNHPAIIFHGRLNRAEVQTFLSSLDCLVVPSLCYENSPTVIIEAVRQGLPVIASDLGGIRELLSDSSYRFLPQLDNLVEKLHWVNTNLPDLQAPQLAEPISPQEYCRKIMESVS